MGIFKKEPDMKCWSCKQLISHKKVKWKPRTFTNETLTSGDNAEEKLKALNRLSEAMGEKKDKKTIASPNQIFGYSEYEYRGQCPECKVEQCGFWFGQQSLFKQGKGEGFTKEIMLNPKPFVCNNCEKTIHREYQVWYSVRMQVDDEIKEYLITLCPECKTEQSYPFEYNLETGIIE